MTEFSEDYCEQDLMLRVEKFKQALQQNTHCYFDVCELEGIVGYLVINGQLDMAKSAAEMGLDLHPTSPDMKICAASILAETGEPARALKLIGDVEKIEFNNDELFLLKASLHSQLKQHRKSVESFRRAVELNTDMQDQVLLDMAFELENMEDYHEAIRTLQKALAVNPENEPALHELGYCYEMLDKNEDLIDYYSVFLDEHPYSSAAWYNLGNIYFKTDAFQKSISAFDFCLVIDEDFTPALFNKANALIQLDRFEEAIEAFGELNAIEGLQAHILCYIGECYEKLDKTEEARTNYEHALELDDQCAEAMVGLAVLLDLNDESKASMNLYRKALKIEPECTAYWHLYALAAKNCKDIQTAEKAFKKALRLNKFTPEVWEDYAVLKAEFGDFDGAIGILSEGFINNDHASELLYRQAFYNYLSDCPIDAEDLLYLAVQRDPDGLRRFLNDCPEAQNSSLMMDFMESGNLEE